MRTWLPVLFSSLLEKELIMNMDRIAGNLKQVKANIKQTWGKITKDQFLVMEGRREFWAGLTQESYGITRDEEPRNHAKHQSLHKLK